MCGLFASISKKSVKKEKILTALKKRGPDGNGYLKKEIQFYKDKRELNFIHTRLSIVDIGEQSNQPFHSSDKRYSIVFNGEIFNYIELKIELEAKGLTFRTDSDTEVLLNGFIYWKEDVLQKLRGIFAFCIWDNEDNSLFFARDHLGVKPLYLLNHGNEFALSSTIESLLVSGLVTDKSINQEALNYYLAYGSFDGKNTLINQIKMFPAGHFAFYKNDHIKVSQFWSLKLREKNELASLRYEEITKRVNERLIETTEMQMRADVDVGAFLSGGIDSGLLVALMSRYTDKQLHTYSIGFEDSDDLLEWDLARLTAKKYNTKHREIKITKESFIEHLDEFIEAIDHPTVDGLNSFLVAKETGKELKVAISGLGGDEAFAGYYFYPQIYKSSQASTFLQSLSTYTPDQFRKKYSFLKYPISNLNNILNNHRKIKPTDNHLFRFDSLEIKKSLYLSSTSIHELRNYTPNILLRDVDAVSMFNSLEVRVPFLDHKIIEYTLSIQDKFKVSEKYNKPLLIDAFPDLLPTEVIKGPKKGFQMPVGKWLKKVIESSLDDLLKDAKKLGINTEIIMKSLYLFNKNDQDYIPIWRFVVLSKWIKHIGLLN